jgi:RND family efflux transporter MFP subunit
MYRGRVGPGKEPGQDKRGSGRVPGRVSTWKQLATAICLVAAAGLLWQNREGVQSLIGLEPGGAEPRATERERGVPVIAAPVRMTDDDLVLEAVGTGRAQRSVTIRAETEGTVVDMPLEAGERYRAGDVLLRLDDTDQRLAVELAETRLAEAVRVRDRYRQLQDTGAAAQARLDEVQTEAEIARIELEAAREELRERAVLAPFDGVGGLSQIDVGDWVDSDVVIASYDDRSVLLVQFELPEALLARVRPGMTVTASTPAVPGHRFEGSVSAIDSRIAEASRTALVRVAIPNPEDRLRPGASFTVRLDLPGDRYPAVPELALQFSEGVLHVWRIEGETVEPVEVRLVRRRAGEVIVEGPLDEGDLVVVEGTQRLVPGQEVTIVKTLDGGST